jgi:hypothetical protein
LITRLKRVWERATGESAARGLRFDRPLLLFQSDDWGRVGIRDRPGWERLRAAGLALGEKPYDFYSLETAADVQALGELLKRHHDSVGRNPPFLMNFIMANVDFDRALASGGNEIPLLALSDGLPRDWQRPALFEAYGQGVQDGIFFPALHGLTHFCEKAMLRELAAEAERAELIRKMWSAQTPYIHWRMPWIGYEYWDAELQPERRFLSLNEQRSAIHRAGEIYRKLFGGRPLSACAPGYRANADTRTAWAEEGVRVVQNGPGGSKAPYLDEHGMLHTFRTIEIEPAIHHCELQSVMRDVAGCFDSGLPAVISIHSINFHSTIRDFRTQTLALLDDFLSAIEEKYPRVLYLHDGDLFQIATEGSYRAHGATVAVGASNMETKSRR